MSGSRNRMRMKHPHLPDINGWAALRAVVERGGVSAAAKALHVGQPAVTKRLRVLESCYGVPLMERVAGRLRMTPAGEKVYLLAVQTLDRHQALHEELQHSARGQGNLRLEVTLSIGEHLLPELLLRFQEQYPAYRVETRVGYSRSIETRLATGLVDLALLENAPDHPEIMVQRWLEDELWLVCGPSHPLAHGSGMLQLEQLTQFTFALREPNSSSRNTLDQALQGVGIQGLNVAMEVGSTDAILEILRRGRHLSFVPRFAVRERVEEGALVRLKVHGFRIMRTLWICRNRAQLDHPVVDAFINVIRE